MSLTILTVLLPPLPQTLSYVHLPPQRSLSSLGKCSTVWASSGQQHSSAVFLRVWYQFLSSSTSMARNSELGANSLLLCKPHRQMIQTAMQAPFIQKWNTISQRWLPPRARHMTRVVQPAAQPVAPSAVTSRESIPEPQLREPTPMGTPEDNRCRSTVPAKVQISVKLSTRKTSNTLVNLLGRAKEFSVSECCPLKSLFPKFGRLRLRLFSQISRGLFTLLV